MVKFIRHLLVNIMFYSTSQLETSQPILQYYLAFPENPNSTISCSSDHDVCWCKNDGKNTVTMLTKARK